MSVRPDIEAFIIDLIADWRHYSCCDIDGGDFQELCVKHGVLVERPATAEDVAEDWAQEYGIEMGETVVVDSPWLLEARARFRRTIEHTADPVDSGGE